MSGRAPSAFAIDESGFVFLDLNELPYLARKWVSVYGFVIGIRIITGYHFAQLNPLKLMPFGSEDCRMRGQHLIMSYIENGRNYMDDGFGQEVYKARKKAKMTAVKLAELAGISRNYLINIEKGRAPGLSYKYRKKIADVLNIPIGEKVSPYLPPEFFVSKTDLSSELSQYIDIMQGIINCLISGARITETKIKRDTYSIPHSHLYTFSITIETTAEIRHHAELMALRKNGKRS